MVDALDMDRINPRTPRDLVPEVLAGLSQAIRRRALLSFGRACDRVGVPRVDETTGALAIALMSAKDADAIRLAEVFEHLAEHDDHHPHDRNQN